MTKKSSQQGLYELDLNKHVYKIQQIKKKKKKAYLG